MFFTRVFLFPLLALFITAALAAPISSPSYSTSTLTTHPTHAGLEKRSPLLFSSDRVPAVKRGVPDYSRLAARDESAMLGARSFEDLSDSPLAKREEGTTAGLVERRSLAKKIRNAFKKAGKKIKSGFKKAGKAIKKAVNKVKKGFKKAGKAIKKGFKKAGKAIKKAAKKAVKGIKKVGRKIKKGIKKAGKAIKKVAKKAWKGIKKAAKKVGKFIKKTGGKIAKFGLKIYATATKIGSKLANFIPGVGKAISKGLDGVSRAANLISDKIPVKLGKKLEKGMRVMDRIQHPIKGAAGKALDMILKRDMELEGLYERDLSELEARSFDEEELFVRDEAELEARFFDEEGELAARSLDDLELFEARSFSEDDS